MSDIDAIINKVEPAEAAVDLCLRGDLMAEYDLLTERVEKLDGWEPSSGNGLAPVDPRSALRKRLADLREQMVESSQTFTFRNLGDKINSDLLAKHPAPKNEAGEQEYLWHPQTYPVALVAASSVEPKMTEDQAGRLFDRLTLAQRNEVFSAAHRANNRDVDIPFSVAVSEPAASSETS